jgi:predicted aspartyl protease
MGLRCVCEAGLRNGILAAVALVGALQVAAPAAGTGNEGEAGAIVLATVAGEERPTIDATVNGEGPFRFFVDTGAGGSVVSAELAARLALEVTGRQRIFNPTSGGAQDVDLVNAGSVASGTMTLEDVQFVAVDLPQLGDMDGVLSVRSLPPGLVSFDFPAGEIRIEQAVLSEADPEVLPFSSVPVMSVLGEVDGRPLTFHVDTGSPDGITLPGSLARELAFDGELVTIRERGPLVVKSGRLRGTVRIGPITLDEPEVQVVDLFPDFGNIGSGFLRDRILTIDRDSRLLRISAPGGAPADASN